MINDEDNDLASNIKYLVTFVEGRLTWEKQIDTLCNKLLYLPC